MQTNDLTIYENYAHEWWNPNSRWFRSLQQITPFRVELINEFVGSVAGKTVADLGCGGGLLALPLLQAGANIIGVDRSEKSVDVARAICKGKGQFFVSDICTLPIESSSADIVLLADVLDHIPNLSKALYEADRILKPGGCMYIGTINRTLASWFFAIFLGENLGFIPEGTHEYRLFIKPEEIKECLNSLGYELIHMQGEWPLFWKTIFNRAIELRKARSTAVAYTIVFNKGTNAK